jgi:hypothetical protein
MLRARIGGGAMLAQTRPSHPARPSTWLFGEGVGIQVWAVTADPRIRVAVLIGQGNPVILLNRLLAGTSDEYPALAWACQQIATAAPGFFVCVC